MAISPLMLAPCSFFASASPAALQFVAAQMQLRHLRKRQLLDDEDAALGLGLVLQGGLQAVDFTLDGKEVALFEVVEHEVFGHGNLLAPEGIALTWVATESSTTVAVLSRQQALELVQFPELVLQLARASSQQVCDLLSWQKIQAINPVSARVCAWFLMYGRGQTQLKLPTHAQLAWRLNTTRESVTRVLQKLLTQGVLERDGDIWHVLMPDELKAWASGQER